MRFFIDTIHHHYADFSGRVSRAEFAKFMLAVSMVLIVAALIIFSQIGLTVFSALLFFILTLLVVVPVTAITTRRLHDTGKSGWWQLLGLIPYVGPILLIVFLFYPGTPGPNQYGPDPKERNARLSATEAAPNEQTITAAGSMDDNPKER